MEYHPSARRLAVMVLGDLKRAFEHPIEHDRIASNPADPLTLQTGLLIPIGLGLTNTYAIDPNYRIGYAQIWQMSIQNDLGHNLVGTLTYNGTKGTALDQTILPNSAPPGGKANGLPSGYIYESANGNSIYHSATFQVMRRFRNGISASGSYTWSKAIDNAVQAQNYLDTSAERAIAYYRHTPAGQPRRRWVAESGAELAGSAALYVHAPRLVYVQLAVLPKHRRQGIGTNVSGGERL